MSSAKDQYPTDALKQVAVPLTLDNAAEKMLQLIPEDQVEWVLIGEGSHGTHEYYQLRGDVTKLLIEKRGFNAVATEADFPDAFKANLWVQHLSDEARSPDEALSEFRRFPVWMWRNREVANFLQWLHDRNGKVPSEKARTQRVGFYGLDLYSLHTSADYVIRYLDKVDPEAAKRARHRYHCFDQYGEDAVNYAFGLAMGGTPCDKAAVKMLKEVLAKVGQHRPAVKGDLGKEEVDFAAAANAKVVKDAEEYYRNMFFKDELTWNIRDTHMADTAGMLVDHLKSRGVERPKIVIWAHNSHLGDARFTDMGKSRGEVNLGQLTRQRYGEDRSFLVGQLGYKGAVAAADDWGSPLKFKTVSPAVQGGHERALHDVGQPLMALDLKNALGAVKQPLCSASRLERAIGVIYRNDSPYIEKRSHYFDATLGRQFDAVAFWEDSSPVAPLDPGKGTLGGEAERHEPPETYPYGQ